jgi:hypothetical protein
MKRPALGLLLDHARFLSVGKSKAGIVLPAEREQCSTVARTCPESLLAIFKCLDSIEVRWPLGNV